MSAEYVLSEGNRQVILCERGIRTFEDSTRNTLDLSIVPNIQGQSHLPIIVDPSHATGRPDLIPAMARAAVAGGLRRHPYRGARLPGAGPFRRPAGARPRPIRPAHGRDPSACRASRQVNRRVYRRLADVRTLLIAGNWKMNPASRAEALALAEAVKAGVGQSTNVRVVLCPPAVFLSEIDAVLDGLADRAGCPEHALGGRRALYGRAFGRDAARRRLHARDPGPQRAPARDG